MQISPFTPSPTISRGRPASLALPDFLTGLTDACEGGRRLDSVPAFLDRFRPGLDSLLPFVSFHPERYARQRLLRSEVFEAVLMCWGEGQFTPIHDHDGQSGFIAVLEGELDVQVYERRGGPRDLRSVATAPESDPGSFPLARGPRVVVPAGSSTVEAAAPEAIHRVGPREGRALSLHVYSRPFDSFLVFDEGRASARRVLVTPDNL